MMSRVIENNLGFLQALSSCPHHQRQYLLTTATPEQVHALVQAAHNVLHCYVPVRDQSKANLRKHRQALSSLASPSTPFKEKKQLLVQQGGGFAQDLVEPLLAALPLLWI